MELRQLRAFATAAEQLSFTRAAQLLEISQPAVSQHVASLEKELGQSLFRRKGRELVLTVAGRQLYQPVREALDLLNSAMRSVDTSPGQVGGTLRIACCTIPPESFLPEVLAAFHRNFPEIRESIVVSDSVGATKSVAVGEADVAFVINPPPETRLRVQPVSCQELILVMAPSHPLTGVTQITPEQLRGQSFIFRELGSGTRDCVERMFQKEGLTLSAEDIVLETNSNEVIHGAVKQGIGIAFVSRNSVQSDIQEGRLVTREVSDLHPRVQIYQVTDTQRIASLAARAFLAFLLGH